MRAISVVLFERDEGLADEDMDHQGERGTQGPVSQRLARATGLEPKRLPVSMLIKELHV